MWHTIFDIQYFFRNSLQRNIKISADNMQIQYKIAKGYNRSNFKFHNSTEILLIIVLTEYSLMLTTTQIIIVTTHAVN